MILAIEQCHKQGFIHRDIKPDVRRLTYFYRPLPDISDGRTSYLTRMDISNSAISAWRE